MIKEESRYSDSNIFEGIVSIRSVIDIMQKDTSNNRRIIRVLYDKNRLAKESKEYSWLCHRAEELSFSVDIVDREEIENIAVGNSHGGIIAVCTNRDIPPLTNDTEILQHGYYVMLDGVEDPYNFGYALRSLYASGVNGILLSERNWMSAAGVVCRSSAGASEQLDMFTVSDTSEYLHSFKQKGYKIVCADLRDSVPLYDAELKRPLVLIIGGEKRGISRSVLDMSDIRVRIDYGREFNASLSAASAATVVGFEVYRQNRQNRLK